MKTLRKVLYDMRRGDVLEILDEGRHDSGFDSGLGSQSLSISRSEGKQMNVFRTSRKSRATRNARKLIGVSSNWHLLFPSLEMASCEAGSSDVSSGSSLPKGMTNLDSSRKNENLRPIRQRQDVC